MQSTWQLTYENNFFDLKEPALILVNQKNQQALRCWIGEMATQLLLKAMQMMTNSTEPIGMERLHLNKHQTQQFLMAACFHHQRSLQQYQVHQNLKANNLGNITGLPDALLYIRMSDQHPSRKHLTTVLNQTAPQVLDSNRLLELLEHQHLIQKLTHQGLVFYDKNPLPHKHLFDPNQQVVIDYQKHLDCSGYEPLRH